MITFCKCGSILRSNGTCSNSHCGRPAEIQWNKLPDYSLMADLKRGIPLIKAPTSYGHASAFGFDKDRTGGAVAWRIS